MTVHVAAGPVTDKPFELGSEWVADGLIAINTSLVISVVDEPDLECDVEIVVALSPESERMLVHSVTALRRDQGPEVTSVMLRTIRVQEYVRQGVTSVVMVAQEDGSFVGFGGWDQLVPTWVKSQVAHDGPTTDSLKWVARIYLLAHLLAQPPAKRVAEELGLAPRTAAHWIAKAKKAGLIPVPNE